MNVYLGIMTYSCHHQKGGDSWISDFDDDKLWLMIIQEIYYMLLRKLCLTGLYLKTQKSEIYRQVNTHAICVDTVRRILKDRSTHMNYVSTQLEELSKIGRHICSMYRHSLKFCWRQIDTQAVCVDTVSWNILKEVDSLERRVNTDFNSQTYQVDAERWKRRHTLWMCRHS